MLTGSLNLKSAVHVSKDVLIPMQMLSYTPNYNNLLEVAKGHTVTYFVARGSTTSANSLFNGVGECGG